MLLLKLLGLERRASKQEHAELLIQCYGPRTYAAIVDIGSTMSLYMATVVVSFKELVSFFFL